MQRTAQGPRNIRELFSLPDFCINLGKVEKTAAAGFPVIKFKLGEGAEIPLTANELRVLYELAGNSPYSRCLSYLKSVGINKAGIDLGEKLPARAAAQALESKFIPLGLAIKDPSSFHDEVYCLSEAAMNAEFVIVNGHNKA